MCTLSNQIIVENVVEELAMKKKMFTAYDVTSIAKEQGADENHYQMKNVVHNMRDALKLNFSYERQLITIPLLDGQDDPQVFVYFPENDDPYDYDPDWRSKEQDVQSDESDVSPLEEGTSDTDSSNFPQDTVLPKQPNLTATSDPDIIEGEVDKRGRLNLTSAMVKRLGVTESEVVKVYIGLGKLWVATDRPGAIHSRQYVVDCDNSVRLGDGTLKLAGICADKYKMAFKRNNTGYPDMIEITGI